VVGAAVTMMAVACTGVGSDLSGNGPQRASVAGMAAQAPPVTTPPTSPPPGDAAIAPAPKRFDGPAPARERLPRHLSVGGTPGPGTWAVVIGIDDYPGSAHDLRSAGADAEDVNAALAGMGVPEDHRLLLKDGQVTRQVLRSAAEWLTARATPDAVAVFFFAGHVRKVGQTTEAMVAADGGTVTDAELAGLLRSLQARHSWVVMAACFGGGFTEVLRPGTILTGAAPADQKAYENLAFGRSYLVQYMVREAMIEGRAPDTVQAAFEYARTRISQDYPARVPVQVDHAGSPLDLRPPGSPRPAPPPPRGVETPATTASTTPPSPAAKPTAKDGASRRSPTTTTTTTKPEDRCKKLVGVLRCGPR
jgi:hypothetical protein